MQKRNSSMMNSTVTTTSDAHNAYSMIDFLKLIMSYLVIGIHVETITKCVYPGWVEFMIRMAVPFFFVASGYFLYEKWAKGDMEKPTLTKFVRIYVLWMLFYLPFAIIYYVKNDFAITDAITDYAFGFFVQGETPMAWHMWYIHAMILVVAVLYILPSPPHTRRGISTSIERLTAVSIVVLLGRIILDLRGFKLSDIAIKSFTGYQSALFSGLPIVLCGMVVKKYGEKIKHPQLMTFVFIVASIVAFGLDIHIFELLIALALILFCVNIKVLPTTNTLYLRELSKYVYFLHLIVVFLLRGRIESEYAYWLVAAVLTTLLSVCAIYITKKLKLKLA